MPSSSPKHCPDEGGFGSAGISKEAVRRQLERILSGTTFAGAGRMRRFLSFVVEETLAGRAERIKEYAIGLEVFDRPPAFDPRADPLVRVEARRLRAKLDSYYEREGRSDPIRIVLPKGGYVPRFEPGGPASAGRPAPGPETIAVLPFTNLGAGPDQEYFSDGLTEELIHALTKVEGLRVVAFSSALQLKGKPREIPQLGKRLHVARLVEGSVRRFGDRLRITVQVIDSATGYYVWSESYDRTCEDLLALQEEIAAAVASALRIRLRSPLPARRLDEKAIAAYNLYLKGRYLWNKRTYEGLQASIRYFEQAAALDSGSALPLAGLADAYTVSAQYGLSDPAEFMPKAKAAALRALELEPSQAEALCSLGFIRSVYDWAWEDAELHYRRAIELNPGYATARLWYGIDFLALLGRFDEARLQLEVAWQLDPLSLIGKETQGYILLLERRYPEAVSAYQALIEEEPEFYKGYSALGRALTEAGRYREAIDAYQHARRLAGDIPNILGALGQTYALAGEVRRARSLLAELHALAANRYVTATCFALIHLGLRDRTAALDWLERSAERRELPLAALGVHPAYDELRSEARFAALLARIGLR